MSQLSRFLACLLAAALVSCSSHVEMPKGTSKGYTSARLIQRDPSARPITDPTEQQVHRMIQNSLAKQFTAKGLTYGKGDAQLAVAYLVLYQEPGMTAEYDDFFGYGRDAAPITDKAHVRGSIENKRPDYFRRAGIVVDVIDAKTNKLVYRNYATGDVVKGASAATRAARIDAAVSQALAAFFR